MMDQKITKVSKGEQLVKTLISLAVVMAILLLAGAMPVDAGSPDIRPFDSRAISSAEIGGGGSSGVSDGFRGLAAEGAVKDSFSTSPASIDTAEEQAALLQRKPKTASGSVETVIGSDRRSRFYTGTYPHTAIGLITFDQGAGSFICTGWLISPDTVATAGHCIHGGGPTGAFSSNVVFFPGKDGASNPFGSCNGITLYFDQTWVNTANEAFDYGAIRLDCTVGNSAGWFGFWWQSATLNNQHALISGYPGDIASGTQQWGSFGAIKPTQARQLFYFNDSFGGMSGSPIYQPDRAGSFCQGTCAMGIHAYGIHGGSPHSNHNHGTRINRGVFNALLFAINDP
jgi:glutamyl endopeptidase